MNYTEEYYKYNIDMEIAPYILLQIQLFTHTLKSPYQSFPEFSST